jgi:hypothetical protein
MDKNFEIAYKNAKSAWNGDPEDFDWDCFIYEIEDLENQIVNNYQEDPFHFQLNVIIQYCRDQINGKNQISCTHPTNEEIASEIHTYYHEKRGQVDLTPPKNYKTALIIKPGSSINEKECALAEGDEEFSENENDDDDYKEIDKLFHKN